MRIRLSAARLERERGVGNFSLISFPMREFVYSIRYCVATLLPPSQFCSAYTILYALFPVEHSQKTYSSVLFSHFSLLHLKWNTRKSFDKHCILSWYKCQTQYICSNCLPWCDVFCYRLVEYDNDDEFTCVRAYVHVITCNM